MKFAFPSSRSAERFAELIDDAGGARRPPHSGGQADEDMTRLVAISNRLSTAGPGAQVDSEFRVGLRAMLVATAERDGIGRNTAEAEPDPIADPISRRRSVFGRRIRARGAIVIGVAAGAMAVSGISAASESASPGDALYSVKRQTERAQLAIAGSDVTRGQLSLDFARTRLSEAVAMAGDEPEFALVMDDMDADTRKGVRLLTTSAVSHRNDKPLTTLNDFVAAQRGTFAPSLEKLSVANRERATASLVLLKEVVDRTEALRAGLSCDTVTPVGSDALGPKLRDCRPDDDGEAVAPSPQGDSGKSGNRQGTTATRPKPAKSAATVSPKATGRAVVPGKSTAPRPTPTITNDLETPAPVEPYGTTDDPLTTDDEGVMDGLLGDFF